MKLGVTVSIVMVASALCGLALAGVLGPSEPYSRSLVAPATKADVISFLTSDPTNEREYDLETYNCLNYTADVWLNAYHQGLDCFIILIIGTDFAHASLGFYSTGDDALPQEYWGQSREWFYVDPQHDFVLAPGNSYEPYTKGRGTIFLSGREALALCEFVKGRGSTFTYIKLSLIEWLYQIGLKAGILGA